jgi:hypothetical protein
VVADVKPEHIITPSVVVKQLDMATMVAKDQDFSADFTLVLAQQQQQQAAAQQQQRQECCAVVVWFDTDFTGRYCAGRWRRCHRLHPSSARRPSPCAASSLTARASSGRRGPGLHCPAAARPSWSPRRCWRPPPAAAPRADHPVKLSTSPLAPPTHWSQSVLTLPEPVTLLAAGAEAAAGDKAAHEIKARISMSRGKQHRLLDIVLEYSAACTDGSSVQHVVLYSMAVEG